MIEQSYGLLSGSASNWDGEEQEKTMEERFLEFNDWLKQRIRFYMDRFSISFSFDDLMMAATLFVLFGDSVKVMSTDKWTG